MSSPPRRSAKARRIPPAVLRGLWVLVSAGISIVVVEAVERYWVPGNDLVLSARVASADFIQRRIATSQEATPPIRVVLLSRLAVADIVVPGTREVVFPRTEMLRLVHLLITSRARAVALDFDMGAAPGDSFRDPDNDPWFFDSLLAIRSGASPVTRGDPVPVVVGVADRSFAPRAVRLGFERFAPLAATIAIPRRNSEFGFHLLAWLKVDGETVESMSQWLADQIPNPEPARPWPGFDILRVEELEHGLSGDSAAYYYPDFSSIPRLVSETLILDSLEPHPLLRRMVEDRIVLVSHEELDERADVPGIRVSDRRLRLAHLHAAGALALWGRPLRMPGPWLGRTLRVTFILLSVGVAGLQARRLMRRRRKSAVDPWLEMRVACVVALVLFLGGAALAAWTRVVIDDVLVEAPLLIAMTYLQMRIGEWVLHRFRPGGAHATQS